MKHRIYLNDGPLNDIELIGDHELMGYITSVNIEVAVADESRVEDKAKPRPCVDLINLETHRYDRFDSWTAEDVNEIEHSFVHQATQSSDSPVTTNFWSRVNAIMTGPDRQRWNFWRFMLLRSLEAIRKTAEEHGCKPLVGKIEICKSKVTDIPEMSILD